MEVLTAISSEHHLGSSSKIIYYLGRDHHISIGWQKHHLSRLENLNLTKILPYSVMTH